MAVRLAWGQVVADRWFRAWGKEHGAWENVWASLLKDITKISTLTPRL